MKRRKFFSLAASGAAGLMAVSSCQNSNKRNQLSPGSNEFTPQIIKKEPLYRKMIKSSFENTRSKSPNDTIILALIGAGGWGSTLIKNAVETDQNVKVKYICDVDDTRGGWAISEIEKKQGLRPIRVRDMRAVFDDKEVDAVLIATPEHWHALATVWACQAGKDVYVEKCISHNISDGQKMIEAAMKYERVIQCGTFNRSISGMPEAKEYIKNGGLGDLVAVHVRCLRNGPIPFNEKEEIDAPDTIDWDMWLGPAPKVPYSVSRNKSWFYYWDYGGGYALSNAVIHQLDLARFILGDPEHPASVYCLGGRYFFDDHRDVPDYQIATYDFGKYAMTVEAGECTPYMQVTPNEIRFGQEFPNWRVDSDVIKILGTKRMMYVGRMGGGWQVFEKNGDVAAEHHSVYALKDHLVNFFDCIRSREKPNSDIVEGHKSSVVVHLANMSYRAGCKQLDFSPEYEVVTNNNKAQELAQYEYRKGFEMPKEI